MHFYSKIIFWCIFVIKSLSNASLCKILSTPLARTTLLAYCKLREGQDLSETFWVSWKERFLVYSVNDKDRSVVNVWQYPLGPSNTSTSSKPFGRWSSSGSDWGIAHFFTAQEIQSREWEKKNKRTNAWVNSSARRVILWHCAFLCASVD